ncbi:hypothetical protein DDR33_21745 [Pararcticibacter amylolyticus]|uniref:Uncharacterized protein n=2 Tax=Pararcticibacter amylolyticus TaxID=2173175 RepID=A0A2U2PBU1_9SPHI|nr:hypothetical protein DDR33_21745 [Pararcticibacter amylolyticus]
MSDMMNTLLAQITDLDRLSSINHDTSQVSTVYSTIKGNLEACNIGQYGDDKPIPQDLATYKGDGSQDDHQSLADAFQNLKSQVKGYKGDLVDAIGDIEGYLDPNTNDIASRAEALPAYIGSAQVHITLYQIYMGFFATQNTSKEDRLAEMRLYIIKLKQYTYWAISTMNDICAWINSSRLSLISPVSYCINIGPLSLVLAYGVTFTDKNETKVPNWVSPVGPNQDEQSETLGIDRDLYLWPTGESAYPYVPEVAGETVTGHDKINDIFVTVRYLTEDIVTNDYATWVKDIMDDIAYPQAVTHIKIDHESYIQAAIQEQQVKYHFTMSTSFKTNHVDLWMNTMQSYNHNLPDSSKVPGIADLPSASSSPGNS